MKKYGGHKIFDDQNVGGVTRWPQSDSVFILFKKAQKDRFQYNFSLFKVLGVSYRWWGFIKFLLPNRGVAVLSTMTFCKFGTPLPKKMPAPYKNPFSAPLSPNPVIPYWKLMALKVNPSLIFQFQQQIGHFKWFCAKSLFLKLDS